MHGHSRLAYIPPPRRVTFYGHDEWHRDVKIEGTAFRRFKLRWWQCCTVTWRPLVTNPHPDNHHLRLHQARARGVNGAHMVPAPRLSVAPSHPELLGCSTAKGEPSSAEINIHRVRFRVPADVRCILRGKGYIVTASGGENLDHDRRYPPQPSQEGYRQWISSPPCARMHVVTSEEWMTKAAH